MTTKEYLHQAYRLDKKINSDIAELAMLQEMAGSISSPQLGERVQTSKNNDAPFVKAIEKIFELEELINEEIDAFVDLKREIRGVIETVGNTDEQMVLRYRYIHNKTWEAIADELYVDARTVRRWHNKALAHVVLPKNPKKI